MNLQWLHLATKTHHGPKRWIYLAYALLLAGTFLFGLGAAEAYPSDLWPYLALLAIFTIQLIWPTITGWVAGVGGWFVFFFVVPVCQGVPIGLFGFLWSVGLLVPLYVFRPRAADLGRANGAATADVGASPRPGGVNES
jgi:hypothetical protein